MRHRNAKIILATVAITGVVGAGVAVAADAPTCPYGNTPKAAQNAPARGSGNGHATAAARARRLPGHARCRRAAPEAIEHARALARGDPAARFIVATAASAEAAVDARLRHRARPAGRTLPRPA